MLADWLVSCYDYSGNVNRASCLSRPMFVGYLWWLFEAESQHRKTTTACVFSHAEMCVGWIFIDFKSVKAQIKSGTDTKMLQKGSKFVTNCIVRNVTSYVQAMSALTVQKLARFRCSHGSARFRTVPFKYFHLFFPGQKFAHLAVQKLAQFHRTRVNATRNCAKMCPCKYLSGPVWTG